MVGGDVANPAAASQGSDQPTATDVAMAAGHAATSGPTAEQEVHGIEPDALLAAAEPGALNLVALLRKFGLPRGLDSDAHDVIHDILELVADANGADDFWGVAQEEGSVLTGAELLMQKLNPTLFPQLRKQLADKKLGAAERTGVFLHRAAQNIKAGLPPELSDHHCCMCEEASGMTLMCGGAPALSLPCPSLLPCTPFLPRVRVAGQRGCGLFTHGGCGSTEYNIQGEGLRRDCDVCHAAPQQLRARLASANIPLPKSATNEDLFRAVASARLEDVLSLPPSPT